MKNKISVITVVRNGEKNIEKTIQSVINQTYNNLEYIIIDGMSTDNTPVIIEKYKSFIQKIVREPDKGIYDAMNKGILIATGKWINFMNVGDLFYSDDIIEEIFDNEMVDYDLVYGDSYNNYFDLKFDGLVRAAPIDQIFKYQVMDHQSLFVKSEILKKTPFNLKYKLAADYNFIFTSYMQKFKFKHVSKIVTLHAFGVDGASESNRLRSSFERWSIVKNYRKDIFIRLYYYSDFIKCIIKGSLRKTLPVKTQYYLLKIKYLFRNIHRNIRLKNK